MNLNLSPKTVLGIFIFLVVFVLVQGTWWVVFTAQLVNEKVEMAEQLGADQQYVEDIHRQEVSRQIVIGSGGVVFLLLLLLGIWAIYRTLLRTQQLKIQQQNFLMAVTHELKTPLASAKLYLDSLQSEKIPLEKKWSVLPRMRQDVVRLETMIENILDAGRFERHAYQIKRERVNLSQLLASAVVALETIPAAVPRSVETDIEPDLYIQGDPVALRRAINAVLENALKYHNGHHVVVNVGLRARGDRALLMIADNGVGLEKADCKAVFERFYRVGDGLTRTTGGSGLGLYLCREMIRLHRGDVTAHSAGRGRGAEFTFSLPLERGDENNPAG